MSAKWYGAINIWLLALSKLVTALGIRERGRRLIHKSFSANSAVARYEVLYFDLFAAGQVRPEY